MHNGDEAIELYRQHQPDITILDLRMPGLSGFDAIAAIREDFPTARIVVLSNYEGSEDVHRALESGAMAYVLKSADGSELIHAIETVHGGRKYVPAALRALIAARVPADQLTERELDVLRLLAKATAIARSPPNCRSLKIHCAYTSRDFCRNSRWKTARSPSSSPSNAASYTSRDTSPLRRSPNKTPLQSAHIDRQAVITGRDTRDETSYGAVTRVC